VRGFLLVFALIGILVRGAIPAGWMPSHERAFAITICAGVDTHVVWLDAAGKLHNQQPTKKDSPDKEPCAFASAALAGNLFDAGNVEFASASHPQSEAIVAHAVTIGQGLAAPPPPATGPPVLI
jgi:hypothetical protein